MSRLGILSSLAASLFAFGPSASVHAQLVWEKTDLAVTAEPGSYQTIVKFPFKNEGAKPVKVKKIKTCCGCFKADADKKVYQPGEAGVIEAVFNHVRKSGVQARNLTVVTDGKQPAQKLNLVLTIPKEP